MKRRKANPQPEFEPTRISGFRPVAFFFALIAFYLLGLTIWSPFYILWPRRYPGTNWFQSVAIRGSLVWQLWSRYVFGQAWGLLRGRHR